MLRILIYVQSWQGDKLLLFRVVTTDTGSLSGNKEPTSPPFSCFLNPNCWKWFPRCFLMSAKIKCNDNNMICSKRITTGPASEKTTIVSLQIQFSHRPTHTDDSLAAISVTHCWWHRVPTGGLITYTECQQTPKNPQIISEHIMSIMKSPDSWWPFWCPLQT